MGINKTRFDSIKIDCRTYDHDVWIFADSTIQKRDVGGSRVHGKRAPNASFKGFTKYHSDRNRAVGLIKTVSRGGQATCG